MVADDIHDHVQCPDGDHQRYQKLHIYSTPVDEIVQFKQKAPESQGFFAALDFPGPLLYTVAVQKLPPGTLRDIADALQQAVQ